MPSEKGSKIKVSAVVSTYNSEKFFRGCLEDLVKQKLYQKGELEIIVIDSGSKQNERAIVEEFQRQYKNIVYIRTEEREGVYAAWNRGIKAARGKYITNANTDDRHRRDALEAMARVLDEKPEIGLVYPDVIITATENETFERHTPVGHYRWMDYNKELLSLGCFIGPQPMWRKSVHDQYGFFDETFTSSGDWEFWLRIAEGTNMLISWDFIFIHIRAQNIATPHRKSGRI
jgi:glycosyltransferase involved in cell wall biosynthesis